MSSPFVSQEAPGRSQASWPPSGGEPTRSNSSRDSDDAAPDRVPTRSAGAPLPTLLAIDTASEQLAIALCVGERQWLVDEAGGAAASARLLPAALGLLADAGIAMAQLDAVAFGQGPAPSPACAPPVRWRRAWRSAPASRCCRSTA